MLKKLEIIYKFKCLEEKNETNLMQIWNSWKFFKSPQKSSQYTLKFLFIAVYIEEGLMRCFLDSKSCFFSCFSFVCAFAKAMFYTCRGCIMIFYLRLAKFWRALAKKLVSIHHRIVWMTWRVNIDKKLPLKKSRVLVNSPCS